MILILNLNCTKRESANMHENSMIRFLIRGMQPTAKGTIEGTRGGGGGGTPNYHKNVNKAS